MSIGSRLKEIRINLEMTQQEMAGLLDIAQNNLHRYENNLSKLSSDKFERLHNKNVNIHWLLSGEGEMFRSNSENIVANDNKSLIKAEETIYIKKLDIQASAGVGFINPDFDSCVWVGLPESFIAPYNPRFIALIQAKGSSMEPTIRSGDLLLISEQHTDLISDMIYIVRVGEELKVKRLVRLGNKNIVVWSENEAFGREEFTPQQWEEYGMQIVARVVKIIKDV